MLRVATFAQEMTDADVRMTGEEMVLENETSRFARRDAWFRELERTSKDLQPYA